MKDGDHEGSYEAKNGNRLNDRCGALHSDTLRSLFTAGFNLVFKLSMNADFQKIWQL